MIELVLLACLLKEPSRCEQHYLPTAEQMGIMECVVTGQFQIVQWRQEHPDWIVRRWTCGAPRA
jgi:hypothetical protein